ncbi:MAG: MATE family efflux transporter [Bacteroidales bacterium]
MNKKILHIAIPNIISNITIPLLGLVDLALVGHLDNKLYIGAISLGGMIFNFLYWGFSFLRMGTSGFAAQAYGQRNLKESTLILSRGLFVAAIGAFFLILFQIPIAKLSFSIIKGSHGVEQLASSYFYIRIWAAPATIGLYALMGWFIGMQNARFPMMIAILINLLNIVFNILLIKVFDMNSDGVALGTVMAQYSGLLFGAYLLVRYYKRLLPYWNFKEMVQLKALKLFYSVNKDIFIRTICLIFVLSFFTAQSANAGDTTLAVNTLLLQFFTIFSYIADGFAYAGEAIVGRYYGARNKALLMQAIKKLFLWGVGLAIPFTLVYTFAGDYLVYLLTDNKEVIAATAPFMVWVFFLPLATFSAFIWDGIYIGATASAGMRNAMLLSTLLFFPTYYLVFPLWGNHGLWLAFVLFMLTRGIVQTVLAPYAVLKKL